MAQTAQEYFENNDNHGGYQYVSFNEILEELLVETSDTDSNLSNVPRSKILMHLKNGVRNLNREIKKTIHAVEITVSDRLYFTVPQDFVDWVRVSAVDEEFRLQPLSVNDKIITAVGYLQDNKYNLLFDNQGGVLKADSSNAYNRPFKRYEICKSDYSLDRKIHHYNEDTYGDFVLDQRRGRFLFSDNLVNHSIVIEYISDGLSEMLLNNGDVTIHKELKDALISYVYCECISSRRNVRVTDKQIAKDHYKSLLHKAKLDAANFNINEIIQGLKK